MLELARVGSVTNKAKPSNLKKRKAKAKCYLDYAHFNEAIYKCVRISVARFIYNIKAPTIFYFLSSRSRAVRSWGGGQRVMNAKSSHSSCCSEVWCLGVIEIVSRRTTGTMILS